MTTVLGVADWGAPDQPFQLDTGIPICHEAGRSATHDRLWKYATDHLGFYGWLRVANHRIERVTTLGLMDLPDRLWRDEYDGRVPPGEPADVAIDETAAEFGIDAP